jgi:hypothetical protein
MVQYAIARLDDIDELADQGYHYRPVRHHFGITSFGVTACTARKAGEAVVGEYDDDSEPSEELFVVVSGCAVFHIDGDSVEAPTGALVYTPPGTKRTAVATEPGTTILAFGGSPAKAYDATGWELWAPMVPLYDSGQHAELASRLKAVIAANPQYPMLVYNLACCESLSGRTSEAIDHLREAIEAAEKFRADARGDADFDPIRDEPAFTALISSPA